MAGDVVGSMALFSFALFTVLAGVFTTYFGQGKSRRAGAALLLVGVAGFVVFGWFTALVPLSVQAPVAWSAATAISGILSIVGAVLGAVVAVGLFLAAIMRT